MRCSVASSWRVAAARLPELARWARREEEKGYLTSMYDPRSICVWQRASMPSSRSVRVSSSLQTSSSSEMRCICAKVTSLMLTASPSFFSRARQRQQSPRNWVWVRGVKQERIYGSKTWDYSMSMERSDWLSSWWYLDTMVSRSLKRRRRSGVLTSFFYECFFYESLNWLSTFFRICRYFWEKVRVLQRSGESGEYCGSSRSATLSQPLYSLGKVGWYVGSGCADREGCGEWGGKRQDQTPIAPILRCRCEHSTLSLVYSRQLVVFVSLTASWQSPERLRLISRGVGHISEILEAGQRQDMWLGGLRGEVWRELTMLVPLRSLAGSWRVIL